MTMIKVLLNFFPQDTYYFISRLKTQITLFIFMLRMFCTIVYFFPHLFPEFVAHAMTPNTLETFSPDNIPQQNTSEVPSFLRPKQKEAAQIAGYTLY